VRCCLHLTNQALSSLKGMPLTRFHVNAQMHLTVGTSTHQNLLHIRSTISNISIISPKEPDFFSFPSGTALKVKHSELAASAMVRYARKPGIFDDDLSLGNHHRSLKYVCTDLTNRHWPSPQFHNIASSTSLGAEHI